jgi:hypothetical protein
MPLIAVTNSKTREQRERRWKNYDLFGSFLQPLSPNIIMIWWHGVIIKIDNDEY